MSLAIFTPKNLFHRNGISSNNLKVSGGLLKWQTESLAKRDMMHGEFKEESFQTNFIILDSKCCTDVLLKLLIWQTYLVSIPKWIQLMDMVSTVCLLLVRHL